MDERVGLSALPLRHPWHRLNGCTCRVSRGSQGELAAGRPCIAYRQESGPPSAIHATTAYQSIDARNARINLSALDIRALDFAGLGAHEASEACWEKAINFYTRSIEVFDNHMPWEELTAGCYAARAECQLQLHRTSDAIADARQSITRWYGHAGAWDILVLAGDAAASDLQARGDARGAQLGHGQALVELIRGCCLLKERPESKRRYKTLLSLAIGLTVVQSATDPDAVMAATDPDAVMAALRDGSTPLIYELFTELAHVAVRPDPFAADGAGRRLVREFVDQHEWDPAFMYMLIFMVDEFILREARNFAAATTILQLVAMASSVPGACVEWKELDCVANELILLVALRSGHSLAPQYKCFVQTELARAFHELGCAGLGNDAYDIAFAYASSAFQIVSEAGDQMPESERLAVHMVLVPAYLDRGRDRVAQQLSNVEAAIYHFRQAEELRIRTDTAAQLAGQLGIGEEQLEQRSALLAGRAFAARGSCTHCEADFVRAEQYFDIAVVRAATERDQARARAALVSALTERMQIFEPTEAILRQVEANATAASAIYSSFQSSRCTIMKVEIAVAHLNRGRSDPSQFALAERLLLEAAEEEATRVFPQFQRPEWNGDRAAALVERVRVDTGSENRAATLRDMLWTLAILYVRMHKFGLAVSLFENTRVFHPQHVYALTEIGRCDEAIAIAIRVKNSREQSRARARGEGSSLAAMAEFARYHADWLEPTLRACIKSGQPSHLRLALQHIEDGRARSLSEARSRALSRESLELESIQQQLDAAVLASEAEPAHLRARWLELKQLSQSAAVDPTSLWAHATLQAPDAWYSEVVDGLDGTAAVVWFLGDDYGLQPDFGCAFVIAKSLPSPRVIEYSASEARDLADAVQDFQTNGQSHGAIAGCLQKLASAVKIDEISEAILASCAGAQQVVLLPHRYLHAVPLEGLPLAPLADGQAFGDRHRHLWRAPSLVQLRRSMSAVAALGGPPPSIVGGPPPSVVAVQNPTENLPGADWEVEYLAGLMGSADSALRNLDVLRHAEATREALRQKINALVVSISAGGDGRVVLTIRKRASCGFGLHIGSHGSFDRNSRLATSVQLAAGERLSVLDVLAGEVPLRGCRLAVLSTCESGLSDAIFSRTEESIGLPAALLAMGVPTVVSTLWSVNDIAVALLESEFYRLQFFCGAPLDLALNGAKAWLRSLTWDAADVELCTRAGAGASRLQEALLERRVGGAAMPFASPLFWMAFIVEGAVASMPGYEEPSSNSYEGITPDAWIEAPSGPSRASGPAAVLQHPVRMLRQFGWDPKIGDSVPNSRPDWTELIHALDHRNDLLTDTRTVFRVHFRKFFFSSISPQREFMIQYKGDDAAPWAVVHNAAAKRPRDQPESHTVLAARRACGWPMVGGVPTRAP